MAATIALLTAIVLGSILFLLLRRWRHPSTQASERGDWSMYQFGGDNPGILQILESPSTEDQQRFGVGAIIEWTYAGSGLPDPQTLQRMHALEDAINPMIDDKTAIHVHTLTGAGLREWCYYTADTTRFENDFNRHVAALPRMPLKILYDPDPEWSYWRKMKARTAA
jgi:hypothetical protein